MGLHISRLALAVALSLHLATPLQAAEQLDEFYTEIKGPDAPPSPLITPQAKPVAQPALVQAPKRNSERTRVAEPVPQPFLVAEAEGASVRSYGPVKPADTLWSIAERMRPSRNVSVHQTMLAIYRSNPSAFAGGRLNGLYRGVRLTIPSQAQIQAESESEAQRLLRQGKMTLAARPATTAAAATSAQRVVKLSPKPESASETAVAEAPVTKPVVKLTPEKPGISAVEPVAESVATTPSDSVSAPAATEMISNKLTIPSQSETVSGAVDASVTALVTAAEPQEGSAAQSTAATAQPLQWQAQYQSEIAALNASNQQLHTQVEQLSKQLDEIKALLAQQASAKNAAEPVASSNEPLAETQPQSPEAEAVTEPETPVEPATTTEPAAKESFFSQLFSNPINLGLLITLPALLVLALVSLWLRAKAKRELASREEVENSSESLLDEGDSHFDHLMAADMVGLGDLPDLEQKDETLQPQPEIVLEERTEPSFQLPDVDLSQPDGREPANRIGKATGWGDAGDPQLVPDVGRTDLGLNEQDLDLAHEMPAPSRGPAQALDEEAFLAELGVSQQDSQPEVVDEGLLHDEPEQPGVVQEADEFQPRESVNLSNDELEALFSSVEEHDAAEFITPATSEPVLTEMEPEPQSTEHTSDEELVLSQHMAELLVPTHEEEAPAANWYNEDDVALDLPAADQQESETSFAATESGFKGIDELLAEAEASSEKDEPYQGLSFDVGLDEFPEVLPGQQGVDVDADGGIGAKLDLARAYLEIDDKPSAIELLNEVLTQGSSEQQSEAERLLKRLV